MGYPKYTIKQNTPDSHQTNPGWIVLFVRFNEPTSMYNPGTGDLMGIRPIQSSVVENDCTSVQITNGKNGFNKSCNLTLKIGDTIWQNAVSPGDWVFVWMSHDKTDMEKIGNMLRGVSPNQFGNKLCSWDSGLKFVGRVVGLHMVDTTSPNGTRTVQQSVSCQAFLEFATSVYYTYVGVSFNPKDGQPSGTSTAQAEQQAAALRSTIFDDKLNRVMKNFASKFLELYQTNPKILSPDTLIAYLFTIIMGIPSQSHDTGTVPVDQIAGALSDAIRIPPVVANILGRPGATYLWQLYNLYLGVQKYDANNQDKPWQSFMPRIDRTTVGDKFKVFWRSPGSQGRCKGVSPFYPPYWTNETMWSIMSQYLNPVVNEMYTALRINSDNTIGPTLIVREQPFSTGLRNFLKEQSVLPLAVQRAGDESKSIRKQMDAQNAANEDDATAQNSVVVKTLQGGTSQLVTTQQTDTFTFFSNLPRWVIDPSMVKSVSVGTSEADRINFVQVWGRNGSAEFLGINVGPQQLKQQQATAGNAVYDFKDIQRNGLRADINETQWDFFVNSSRSGSWAPDWAKMRADWLFNGHLKLKGSITCNGIKEPICEGDNLQYRGMVYHIDSVSHSASIDARGNKQFTTTMQISNGLRALRLNEKDAPLYAIHRGIEREDVNLPGVSLLQDIPDAPNKKEG